MVCFFNSKITFLLCHYVKLLMVEWMPGFARTEHMPHVASYGNLQLTQVEYPHLAPGRGVGVGWELA